MKKNRQNKVFFLAVFALLVIVFFVVKKLTNSTGSEYQKVESITTHGTSESCLQCHANTQGYSEFHNPQKIGCTPCHLGNKNEFEKEKAHQGMILIPGNLSDAEQTCGTCHASELHKVNKSLMTTNSGLVAVDKYIFGEAHTPDSLYHIKDIGHSPSEKHIRDLCANCHLGAEKKEYGPITELSRGGGCNACHLNYSEQAHKDFESYIRSDKKKLPHFHPSTDLNISNTHCYGCHSRSSRISTNYEGLQETLLQAHEMHSNPQYVAKEDGRVYKHLQEDVHHTKGLLCVDCHSSHEVMGNGKKYAHEEQAVTLQCSDCHFKDKPNTMAYDSLDTESSLVFFHRKYRHSNQRIIATKKDNHPLVNTYVDQSGKAFLIGKKDGKTHPLSPQPDVCAKDKVHQEVSCASCHSSWTSKCIGCHNQFDKEERQAFDLLDKKFTQGQWKEYVAEFSSSLPALGVRENEEGRSIEPALPGMILTIDKGSYANKESGEDVSFHRLYAPNSPHTTTKQVRDCKSCHANPNTLGYGNGVLKYKTTGNSGIWAFTPEYALNSFDNLPEDAWIPFLQNANKTKKNSTRLDFRPFTKKEQQRILKVGACLQCHKQDSEIMLQTLQMGFDAVLKKKSEKCIVPNY